MTKINLGSHKLRPSISEQALIDELNNVAPEVKRLSASHELGEHAIHFDSQLVRRVASKISAIPYLKKMEEYTVDIPGGGTFFRAENIAPLIMKRLSRYSPDEILDSLRSISQGGSIKIMELCPLRGIRLDKTVILDENFKIVPFNELPNDAVLRSNAFRDITIVGEDRYRYRPTVVRYFDFNPKFTPPPYSEESYMQLFGSYDEKIWQDIIDSIALTSKCYPRYVGQFSYVSDPGWIDFSSPGSVRFQDEPYRDSPYYDIDDRMVINVFQKMKASKLKLAPIIRKLLSSRGRKNGSDRAIDLATCVEMITMRDDTPGEIAYKLSSRAAWLVGDGSADRVKIFDQAKELYDMRSKAAHTGEIPFEKFGGMGSVGQKLDEADNLCVRLILKLLEVGTWPKWKFLTLGGNY